MQAGRFNATIVGKAESLTAKDLGIADLVEEDTEGKVTRISGCKNPKTIDHPAPRDERLPAR